MPSLSSRTAVVGFACTLLGTGTLQAADWNGSYVADGRCYCSGELAPALARRIVPTPIGGQSVAKVCARIGAGPGLTMSAGRFDRVVYADAQCGHGPFVDGAETSDRDCPGSREPGGGDCHGVGPRWDLAAAFSTREARAADAVAAAVSERDATPAVPVVAAARPTTVVPARATARSAAVGNEGNVVVIDGRRWREAPPGTPRTGSPGSRIIVDDKVFLDADDPLFASVRPVTEVEPSEKPSAGAARRETSRAARPEATRATRRAVAPPDPEAVRARQERLLAEARERLRRRRAAEAEAAASAETAAAPRAATEVTDDPSAVEAAPTDRPARPSRRADAPARPVVGIVVAPASDASDEQTSDDVTVTADEAEGQTSDDVIVAADEAEGRVSDDATVAADEAARERSGKDASEEAGADAVAEAAAGGSPDEADDARSSPFLGALRLPEQRRFDPREVSYVDAMPVSYDFGGAGVFIEGSAPLRSGARGGLRLLARLGAAAEYQEVLIGAGYSWSPAALSRLSFALLAGVETGRFELDAPDVETELSDVGGHVAAATRLRLSSRFALQAGIGYSSFFEGDGIAFGGGSFRVNPRLDFLSRFELGDNDSIGIGLRYHY